jgi:outer membrane protein assembly factor BamA
VRRRIAIALLATLVALASRPAQARLVIKRILVHGAHKTETRVLSNRMHLAAGDALDYEKLRDAEQRLIESELFSDARVYIEMSRIEASRRMYVEATDTPVDLHVELTEKQSWFVIPIATFGGGDYSGGAAYGDRNLFGRDVQLLLAGQVGQSRSFIYAGYRDPLLVGAPLTWGAAGLFRYENIRFYANHELVLQVPTLVGGAEAEIGWVLSPHLQATLGFSARYQRVREPNYEAGTEVPLYNPRSGRIFRLVFQAIFDNTIAPVGLRRGVRLLFKNEVADQFWGSEFDYSKFEGRTEFYARLGWNYPSLIFKTVFDFPSSSRGVPISEILRLGGANLRGYLFNEFHGDTLVSLQLEDQALIARGLKLPLVSTRFNLAGAAFVDAATLLERHPGGTALDLPVDPRPKLRDVHTSVGVGLRIILPGVAIPAIKADVGYGIDVHSFAATIYVGSAS